ncbi:hypothetical protein ACQVWA_18920 [Bacillus cereus]
MPNYLFSDSSAGNQPALLAGKTGLDSGLLIAGLKCFGANVFLALNNDQI